MFGFLEFWKLITESGPEVKFGGGEGDRIKEMKKPQPGMAGQDTVDTL